MKWTKEKPQEQGFYWIYVKKNYEDKYRTDCIEVAIWNDKISFNAPVNGYEWEFIYEVENVLYWMGPLKEPAPPK